MYVNNCRKMKQALKPFVTLPGYEKVADAIKQINADMEILR